RAATVLAVAYPHMCGVGGDLFALVQRPDGETLGVSSSGRAPAAADPSAIRSADHAMPIRGPAPITVPGAVAGWRALHGTGAVLPWGDAFSRAIELAIDGVPVARSLAETLAAPDEPFGGDPGLSAIFFADGIPSPPGATVRQSALGTTLTTIEQDGPEALYGGAIGRAYVGGLNDAGSSIAIEDLAAHRALVLPPLRAAFRDLHVSVVPPNSQGFVLLEILSLLERLGIDADPHGSEAGAIARVFASAARDRDRHLADPDHMTVHPSTLLDDGHLASLADEIRLERPAMLPSRPNGDTIALVAADAEGFAVSLIQSLFWGFGSGICEPTTGIVAQNRGACFTLEPGHPNAFAPGKLPAHTLMPVLVHDERGVAAVAGSMGGYAQPQINAQTLLHLLGGAAPADAVAAPRWILERAEPASPARIVIEEGVPVEARRSLGSLPYPATVIPDRSAELGHAHLIRVRAGGFDAGADPRSDGGSLAG
ncbi:MAG: gamma-glutamyltransferase, partial [Actinomycetota bacterium]|nr:gamma-glutamyltransferase [Actinomycetota bacterium]